MFGLTQVDLEAWRELTGSQQHVGGGCDYESG